MGDVRSASGLIEKLPKAAQVLADTAYDSDKFREFLIARGSTRAALTTSAQWVLDVGQGL
jgi:hypothetical protein